MLIKNRGTVPVIDKSTFVASSTTLVGNIRIGRDSRIMYGTTLISKESRKKIIEHPTQIILSSHGEVYKNSGNEISK